MLRHATEIGSLHTYASAWERAPSTFLLVALGCAACALVAPARAQASLPRNGSSAEPSAERPIRSEPDRVGAPHGERASLDATTSPYDEPAQKPDLERLAQSVRDRVYHHPAGEDGTLWARGEAYKARFGTEGASYVPFLGSRAPRNFPVDFRLAEVSVGGAPIAFETAVPAQRTEDTIRYERGALVELYELELGSIEQKFVFDELPARGELVVRIATETEFEARELPERLEFTNELGAVRYGRATAIDASGSSVSAPTIWTGEGIEIRVPAAFVAQASLPLVIDPILSTFSVDTNMPFAYQPDCALDASTSHWLVVYEEVFSQTDHDVVWRLLWVLSGQYLLGGYVDTNLGDDWRSPACANNNALDRFLVVAEIRNQSVPVLIRRVAGRVLEASNGALGPTIEFGDSAHNAMAPDVGGDPYPTLPSNFLVVWASDDDVQARLVSAGGTLSTSFVLVQGAPGTGGGAPSVSKSTDSDTWNLVWEQYQFPPGQFTQVAVQGARIQWTGQVVASPFLIEPFIDHTRSPSAATCLNGSQRWLVAHLGDQGGIELKLLDGSTVVDEADLSGMVALSSPGTNANELPPDVDCDGWSFAVAHSEYALGAGPNGVRVSTVAAVGNELRLSETQLITSSTNVGNPSIGSADGSGLAWRLHLVAYDQQVTGSSNGITGTLYDNALVTSYCHPTHDGVPACPCGNDPGSYGHGCNNSANAGGAQLFTGGNSSVGSDSLTLHSYYMPATALTIFNQGNAVLANAAVFGQGLRCVGGSLKRLYIKTAQGGVASAPVPGDPDIHTRSAALGDPISAGGTRGYYAYYRDPVVPGGCPSGSTFNTSQSIQAIWIP